MPSKLSLHLSSYPNRTFEILGKMKPSVVKVFNQSSEINIGTIMSTSPKTIIVYRQYTNLDYRTTSADQYFAELQDTFNKLAGRGLLWEGINEPIVSSIEDAKALNRWWVRFAEIMHARGEKVAGFSWSTGNPTPDKLMQIIPYITEAAAAMDAHAFHEYYTTWGKEADWGRYRVFEQALPAHARKPVVITEAGLDDNGDPRTGGWLGKISAQQYLDILKRYDALLLQDPYVLGATVYQWGDGNWPSFELDSMIDLIANYVAAAGQGVVIPSPWPLPSFGPVFNAVPSTISLGDSATLSWQVNDAGATVYLDGQVVAAQDTRVVTPTETTTYTLKIVFADNTQQELTATVTVTAVNAIRITDVTFNPPSLRVGELLNVSITVRNDTTETLQTQGPDPGFIYDEGDTFQSRGFPSIAGAVRVGVDFGGRTGIDHPYRWGLGAPLAPGQSATITGSIRLKTVRSINYWVGLVREHIAWLQDRQGVQNITVAAAPSGIAEITNVQFTPTTLRAGELLNVSITVRNGTNDTLQTQGPDPGFVYDEGDDFRSRGFSEVKNAFRVGIDFDGRTSVDHPYRWGLGAPLAPGQSVTITGAIRLKTARTANYWVGLVREQVAWLQDKKGGQAITVTPAGVPQITSVTFTPLSVPSGNVLNVSITVKNESADTLPTQGPDPGFVYEEGDTFRSRGFTEIRGAFRVGVDFDGRTGIDHPYRWGLGAPLAPGQSATITGSIRLKTQRTVKYWAGLVREQIVWMQDKLGTQSIVVTPPVAPPPPPTPTLEVSPTTITAGQSATVTWNAPSATSVSLNGQPVSAQGTLIVSPTQSTTYTLNIVYADGSTRTLTVNLTVNPAPTISFTATPSTIAMGGSSTLQWSAPGNSMVTLDGVTVLASGSRVVTPAQTTTYTLRVVLADGTVRTLTATVTVSTQPQPTKPPTVPITPENVALLKTFPRPANDNGRGLHFNIDLRDSTIAIAVPHLLSINCKWTMIYAQDEQQARRAAKACWDVGIMPIVRIGKKVDEAFDPIAYVNVLKQIGAPPYVQIYNEPGDIREWKVWPGNDRWIGIYAPRWAQMAATVFDAGGYPGLQILGKEEFDAVVASVQAINRTDIWQRAFFALHNYGANHPPAYPYDPRNQQDHPGATIFDDDVAVLNFLAYAKWMKDGIGFVLPIIGGEGGWEFGAEEDNRYPKVNQPYHANYHKEMFDWFRTGVLSNGEPLPDYLFSITPWIEGGWGADDWWGGVLGDKTETIQAVQSIPPFVRKFSWDGGAIPPPSGNATFTVTPDTIDAGGSATLRWNVTGASSVTLDGESVTLEGTRTVSPPETTTYVLHIVWGDNTTQDLTATVTVRAVQPPPQLIWDPRLDPLGVKLTRTDQSPAWRLTSGLYQNEFESGGNHNVYFTLQKADGTPAAGVTVVADWVGRDPSDRPSESITDANGQTNIPIWAILHPELQDGPYFAYVKGSPSDKVSGMGLPVNRHVNFLLTFRFS